MNQPKCGCVININCAKHKAAEDMYEALKYIDSILFKIDLPMPEVHIAHIKIQNALAKADSFTR